MAEKFEEKTSGEYDAFEKKGEISIPKEERGHIRSAEEVERARESIPEDKKIESAGEKVQKAEDWRETFYKMGGTRGRERIEVAEQELAQEKKTVESAQIPKESIKTETILKEAGIQKPAESFKEAQERLGEKLEKAKAGGGEKPSLADKNELTRDFYLGELGYSVKYKGLLHGKSELLDEAGKTVADEKGKSMEFKTFFKLGRKETPMIDFLKEKLQEKLEGKSAKETTEEEKLEAGFQKTIKEAKNAQATREEKISFLQEAKKAGAGRLSKVFEGLAYVAGFDKLAVPFFKEGKKLAVDGGKDLAAIGLSPAVAIEEAGREIAGRIQVGEALRKGILAEGEIKMLKKIPAEKRDEYFGRSLEIAQKISQRGTEELVKGREKMLKKGKILSFLEKWTWPGGLGKAMGERLTPHPSKKEKYE